MNRQPSKSSCIGAASRESQTKLNTGISESVAATSSRAFNSRTRVSAGTSGIGSVKTTRSSIALDNRTDARRRLHSQGTAVGSRSGFGHQLLKADALLAET